jgi:hypothetical protein
MPKFKYSLRAYDSGMLRFHREIKRGFDKADPLLGQIRTVAVSHGGNTRQVSEPTIVETEMKQFSQEVVIETGWLRSTDIEKFTELMWNSCQALISDTKKYMFEILGKTTEAVGNSIPLAGRNVWDAQIEALERTEIRFDKDGNHHYQTVLHPDTYKKLMENPPTPEQERRWHDTMDAKKAEYYAKKRTRRLS